MAAGHVPAGSPTIAAYGPPPAAPALAAKDETPRMEKWGFWLLPAALIIPPAAIGSVVLGIILATRGKGVKAAVMITLAVVIFTVRFALYVSCDGRAWC